MEQRSMRKMMVVGFFVALISGIVMAAEKEKPVADDWFSGFRNPAPGIERKSVV